MSVSPYFQAPLPLHLYVGKNAIIIVCFFFPFMIRQRKLNRDEKLHPFRRTLMRVESTSSCQPRSLSQSHYSYKLKRQPIMLYSIDFSTFRYRKLNRILTVKQNWRLFKLTLMRLESTSACLACDSCKIENHYINGGNLGKGIKKSFPIIYRLISILPS